MEQSSKILRLETKKKMIIETNLERAKQKLKLEEGVKIIKAIGDEFNRKIIEYGKFDVLIGVENLNRKMNLKYLDSGLNPFLASLMSRKGIKYGIDLDEIRKMKKIDKQKILSQTSQNIKLCRKNRVKLALFGVKDKKDASALLQCLGASSYQTKEALGF